MKKGTEMIDLLRVSRVFKELTDDELQEVANCCQRVSLEIGERIFEAETPAEYLFIVGRGSVELRFRVTHYHATKEIILERKFKGDTLGWSALAEPYVYTLSAVTMQDSELLKLKASDIKGVCEQNKRIGYVLMKNISEIIGERFASIQRLVIDLIQDNLNEKQL
ncbi:MAG: Crp/Fnr family transcriptional regulator [bacterium]